MDALKQTKPCKAYAVLKSMGVQPGDCTDDLNFTLPSHQEAGLTDTTVSQQK